MNKTFSWGKSAFDFSFYNYLTPLKLAVEFTSHVNKCKEYMPFEQHMWAHLAVKHCLSREC